MGLAMGSFFRYEDGGFMTRNPPKDLNSDKSPVPLHSYSPSPNTSRAGSDVSAEDRSTPVPPSVPDIQLFTSPLAGLPFPTTPGRLSTTCRICFKTFACNSALEIHYRSHTKERPFKCSVCDRGFTTKGNMKQHLLTHKSRDLQPLLFASTDNSVPDSETNSSTNVTSPRTSSPVASAFETNLSQTSNHSPIKTEPIMAPTTTISAITAPPAVTAIISTPPQVSSAIITSAPLTKPIKTETEGSSKRHLPENSSATPSKQRTPTGVPKHFCHICQKPFSSASALQIHNRTHSGEKPFKCVVCGRAFTTKGNLKVHMNTHMAQNNGNSRRGRRMSLEFQPPPLPAHIKQEYPHHARPDLYFPYLPPGYINGLACPPKMNEISVIQTAAGITNGNISTPSTMNLTPAVSMMTPAMTLGQHQPFIRKQVQQSTDSDGSNYVGPRSPDEAENLKIQPSPSPPLESASPIRPIPSSPSTASDNAACWNWKTACNICNKICSSSSDLELHLKTHCNP
ncbi:homeotic protein spalt-major [Caerostris extrusa]|uniref:Homeotic protein spalt-major n=1 Tax=Caerostris extrusa TaxID=172846 RepID=A0AAV4RSE4_CAEEX|nr:homeotic protein spalt-major [Caerostris extrusa]